MDCKLRILKRLQASPGGRQAGASGAFWLRRCAARPILLGRVPEIGPPGALLWRDTGSAVLLPKLLVLLVVYTQSYRNIYPTMYCLTDQFRVLLMSSLEFTWIYLSLTSLRGLKTS